MFRPGHRAGVFIWENFHPGYRDLDNRASPASHMDTPMFLQRKEWRGEASPVDWAHMKRPLEKFEIIGKLETLLFHLSVLSSLRFPYMTDWPA